jgi:hypothetical protein
VGVYGQLNAIADPATRQLLQLLFDQNVALLQQVVTLQTNALQRATVVPVQARLSDVVDPQEPRDAVNVRTLRRYVQAQLNGQFSTLEAQIDAIVSGEPGQGSVTPLVPLANLQTDVQTYAAMFPLDLANSCVPSGGTWDFMDGLVAYLQAIDERVGFNGKRGDVTDPSGDAIAYYHGPLPPVSGSNDVYVVDVIIGHCGPTPFGAWQDVTTPLAAGAWMPTR